MTTKSPWHLWFVGVASLLWNSVGAFDYIMTKTKNESYMAAFSTAQLDYFYNLPAWAVASWAIAIWSCVLGSVLTLFKKKPSVPVFLISIAGLIVTTVHNYGLSNGYEIMGGVNALIFTGFIYITTFGLYFYARTMTDKGILN